MTPYWICLIIFMLLIPLFFSTQRKKAAAMHIQARKQKEKGETYPMETMIQRYLGTNVTITTINETHTGVLTGYTEGWVTLDYKGKIIELNGDYIVKLEPRPDKKK